MAKPTLQGGVKNYLGSQRTVSNVPVKWKSGPDKPETELAYITEAEKDLLLKADIHGSLSKGPNMGPGGLMSLDSWGDRSGGQAGAEVDSGRSEDRPERTTYSTPTAPTAPTAPVHDFDVGPTISAEQSVAMIGNTSLAGSSPDYAQAVVDAGYTSDPQDTVEYQDWKANVITGDAGKREEVLGLGNYPEYPKEWETLDNEERIELEKQADLEFLVNKGLLQKDLETGELVEGRNVRDDQGNIVSRDSIEPPIEEPTGGEGITTVPVETDIKPTIETAEDTGLTEAENRALIDAYGYGKTVPVDIQDLGPREISPLADQRMQRDYAENVRLMAEPRTLSAQGGRAGYKYGEFVSPHTEEDNDDEETIRAQALASLPEYQLFSQRRKAMLGGRMGYNQGGIVGLRQPFFVGKLVKKITKPIKKIVKSPIGKAALLAAGLYFGPRLMPGGAKTWFGKQGFFPTSGQGLAGFKERFMPFLLDQEQKAKALEFKKTLEPINYKKAIAGAKTQLELDKIKLMRDLDNAAKAKGMGMMDYAMMVGIPASMIGVADYTAKTNREAEQDEQDKLLAGLKGETEEWRTKFGTTVPTDFQTLPYTFAAKGGRIGAQEGGLMNLGGMEKDYRQEGGFVPIGRKEKADDVPARLSKNEFVFTADAVRAAGGGDIDEGAAVMERLMENLEAGGKVSEESQGLEGARAMFANTKKIENRII